MRRVILAIATAAAALVAIQANAQNTETWTCRHLKTGDSVTFQVDMTASPQSSAMVNIPMYPPVQARCDNCTPPIITWYWDMGANACGRFAIWTDDSIGVYDKLECGTPRKLRPTMHLVCEVLVD